MEALARSPQHRGAYSTRIGRPAYDDEKEQAGHRASLEKIDRKVMWALASNHQRDFDGNVPAVYRAVEANRKRLQQEAEEFERSPPTEAQLVAMSIEELERSRPRMEDILRTVCAKHGLTRVDITSRSNSRRLVYARHEFWFLCAKLTLKSYPEMGHHIGRDHSTAIHGVRGHGKRNGVEKLPRGLEYRA